MHTLLDTVKRIEAAGRVLDFATIERGNVLDGQHRFTFYFDNGTESRSVLRVTVYRTPTGKPKKNRQLSFELNTYTQYDHKRRSFLTTGSTFGCHDTYDAKEIKAGFALLDSLTAKLPRRDSRHDSALITNLYAA